MDERPDGGADLPDGPEGPTSEPTVDDSTDPAEPPAVIGLPPDSPAVRELVGEAAEIRRMVEAGAGSPEAIRELAARLREHRAREESLWRSEVKPSLVREGRGRFRGHNKPASERADPASSQALGLGLGLLALVALVIVAANTSAWLLILPVVGIFVYAWSQGRDSTGA